MVQERYGVQLPAEERSRLRQMIRSGQVLLAVWLLATVEGIGSARRLARLCQEHDAYRAITRAHILLKLDEGWTAPKTAGALDVESERTVFRSSRNGGMPRRDWTACCSIVPRPTGTAGRWTTGVKPT